MPLRPRPVPTLDQKLKADRHEWHRAGGNCVCAICGEIYYKHPYFSEPYEWLTLLCDGTLVKL